MNWPHEDLAALNAFYGDPRGHNGEANPLWEKANLVHWTPPYPMYYSDKDHRPMNHLRVHRNCLDAFQAAFGDAFASLGHAYIIAHRLDVTGGTFCYRLQRGGSRLSVHSWGCAIDIDPAHNPFPRRWAAGRGMLDPRFAQILQSHGFVWRGAKGDNDPMHLQLAQR